jgi:hypothetical protein
MSWSSEASIHLYTHAYIPVAPDWTHLVTLKNLITGPVSISLLCMCLQFLTSFRTVTLGNVIIAIILASLMSPG